MSTVTPNTPNETVQQAQQDVKGELPSSNPWLESGLLRALTVMTGRRAYDLYKGLDRIETLSWPFDAKGKYLQFWATLKNMYALTAAKSAGEITFTGTVGQTVTSGSIWTVGTTEYSVDANVNVEVNTRNVSTLTASVTTATCVLTEDHNLSDGMSIDITGAVDTDWNDTFTDITVTGAQTITFAVTSGISTPAVGTIVVSFDAALGSVTSVENGEYNNQTNGVTLTSQSTLPGIDSTAGTQYTGLIDGRDDETTAEYQARVVSRWQNPQTPFNAATIIDTVKNTVGGGKNTRIWVYEVTPKIGAVTIYFVRDEDESIIPDASEIAEAKAAIVAIKSPQTDDANIHVNDTLTAYPINIVMSQLIPSTTTMKESVKGRIRNYFRGGGLTGGIGQGDNFSLESFKSDLYQTRDYQTGERLLSFDLQQPVSDQTIADGEIATEGITSVG